MHCDIDQQNSVNHIWQTVRDIGVNRIDHGVNAFECAWVHRATKDRYIAELKAYTG